MSGIYKEMKCMQSNYHKYKMHASSLEDYSLMKICIERISISLRSGLGLRSPIVERNK